MSDYRQTGNQKNAATTRRAMRAVPAGTFAVQIGMTPGSRSSTRADGSIEMTGAVLVDAATGLEIDGAAVTARGDVAATLASRPPVHGAPIEGLAVATDRGYDLVSYDAPPHVQPSTAFTVDATVLSAQAAGEHARLVADVDGVETAFAMMPIFGSVDGLVEYAARRIGAAVRLYVEAVDPVHALVGVPDGMRVVDTIVPLADLRALDGPYAEAA